MFERGRRGLSRVGCEREGKPGYHGPSEAEYICGEMNRSRPNLGRETPRRGALVLDDVRRLGLVRHCAVCTKYHTAPCALPLFKPPAP